MADSTAPITFDTAAQWQRYFDATFPNGMLATQIRYSEASARTDDSPQALITSIRVVEVTEDGDPLLSLLWTGLDKDTLVEVETVERRDNGCHVTSATPDDPDYLFSYNLTAGQREAVAAARQEAQS